MAEDRPDYAEWVERKVYAALADTRRRIPHDEVTREFAERKAKLRARLADEGYRPD